MSQLCRTMNCNAMWEACRKKLTSFYIDWKLCDISTSKVYYTSNYKLICKTWFVNTDFCSYNIAKACIFLWKQAYHENEASLIFVLKPIGTFNVQNKKLFFMHMSKNFASLSIARERKTGNSFHLMWSWVENIFVASIVMEKVQTFSLATGWLASRFLLLRYVNAWVSVCVLSENRQKIIKK